MGTECHAENDMLLQRYHRLEEIGHGEFGVVYRVISKGDGKEYAVKLVTKGDGANAESDWAALQQELSLWSTLHHPCILQLNETLCDMGKIQLITRIMHG